MIDKKNKVPYIISHTYDKETSLISYIVYNYKMKLVDKDIRDLELLDNNNLLVIKDTSFKIYDRDINLIFKSKEYNKVYMQSSNYIVANDNGYLKIINSNDSVVATFPNKWDETHYSVEKNASGWYKDDGKEGIFIVIFDKNISTDKKGSVLEFYYAPSTKESGIIELEGDNFNGYAKPVLYLYPEEDTDVIVKFEKPELLTTTYPKFVREWNVLAKSNGDLYDKNGKYYYALYWEEKKNHNVDFGTGFYVESDNAIEFLEEKLSIIGLNDRERNEFIMYWLPILKNNGKNLVYFELTEERDSYNKLIITPKPNALLRVAIHVKKVDGKTSIKEQVLTSFKRIGFTAVEWGGINY